MPNLKHDFYREKYSTEQEIIGVNPDIIDDEYSDEIDQEESNYDPVIDMMMELFYIAHQKYEYSHILDYYGIEHCLYQFLTKRFSKDS